MPTSVQREHALRNELRTLADPRLARTMKREHPGDVPFLGIPPLTVVRVVRRHLDHPVWRALDRASWQETLRGLWSTDTTREFRHAVVAITRHPVMRAHAASPASTTFYRDLLVDRPTTDGVDALAAFSLALPLAASPESETPVIRNWAVVGSPWLRRAALLSQTRRFRNADPHLLRSCIGANLSERRRLVREVIPRAVAAYAHSHPEDLPEMREMFHEWTDRMPQHLAGSLAEVLFPDEQR